MRFKKKKKNQKEEDKQKELDLRTSVPGPNLRYREKPLRWVHLFPPAPWPQGRKGGRGPSQIEVCVP